VRKPFTAGAHSVVKWFKTRQNAEEYVALEITSYSFPDVTLYRRIGTTSVGFDGAGSLLH